MMNLLDVVVGVAYLAWERVWIATLYNATRAPALLQVRKVAVVAILHGVLGSLWAARLAFEPFRRGRPVWSGVIAAVLYMVLWVWMDPLWRTPINIFECATFLFIWAGRVECGWIGESFARRGLSIKFTGSVVVTYDGRYVWPVGAFVTILRLHSVLSGRAMEEMTALAVYEPHGMVVWRAATSFLTCLAVTPTYAADFFRLLFSSFFF